MYCHPNPHPNPNPNPHPNPDPDPDPDPNQVVDSGYSLWSTQEKCVGLANLTRNRGGGGGSGGSASAGSASGGSASSGGGAGYGNVTARMRAPKPATPASGTSAK